MAAAIDVVAAAVAAAAVAKVQWQGQIVALGVIVINYSRGGAAPRGDSNWRQTVTFWLFFGICVFRQIPKRAGKKFQVEGLFVPQIK